MKALYKYIFLLCALASVACSATRVPTTKTKVSDVNNWQSMLVNASNAYQQNKLDEANRFLDAAISENKNCDACYYLLANIFAKIGKVKEAATYSKMAFDIDTTNFWYAKQLAQLLELDGSLEQSAKIYEYILKSGKNKTDVLFNLATLYSKQKQYSKALAAYDTIQKISGISDRLVFSRQQLYYATGNTTDAMKDALLFYQREPENPQANVLLGEIFARSGNDSLAVQYFQNAYKLDNTYPISLFELAELYRKNYENLKFFDVLNLIAENQSISAADKLEYVSPVVQYWQQAMYSDKVENLLKDLYEKNPESWECKEFYATFLIQTNHRSEGVKIIDDELAKNKKNVAAWKLKIPLLAQAQNNDAALAAADTALFYLPGNEDLLMYKAMVCYDQKNYNCVFSTIEKAADTSKNKNFKVQSFAFLGDAYHANGNAAKAFVYYEKALQIDSLPVVLNNYAYFLSQERKDLKRALALAKSAVDKSPNSMNNLDTYAWILHLLKRDAEAKPIFLKAMASGGRDSFVLLDHYGDVLFALKDYKTAIFYWQEALSKKDVANADKIKEKVNKAKQKID